ncbi:MAG: DUF4214 domain-containing protein [Actinobacteria bacterium]|nr:DUF4214 domain-containing protein [Actinomycetota bacterium]
MKKKILRISLVFILVFMILAIAIPQFLYADSLSDVSSFVTRFYMTCLNRMPDPAGLSSWTNGLISGRLTGAQVAYGFIFSEELLSKNLPDGEFLNIMYSAFFNRPPDAGGFSNWMGVMANEGSRQYVLAGFVNSLEFKILCDAYGIQSGSLVPSGSAAAPVASNTSSSANCMEINLFNAVNAVRAQYGIGQLSLNSSISNIARSRSTDMMNRNYFSHITPDGKSIFTILNENGIGWQFAGENIYQCCPAANGSESVILNTWMSSSSHRDILLNGAFHQIGIGIIDSGNTRTVTIVFIN